jgi:hypothetical protein
VAIGINLNDETDPDFYRKQEEKMWQGETYMSDYTKRLADRVMRRLGGLPRFETETQARAYLRELTADLDCVDNLRFAYVGNEIQEHKYRQAEHNGCCGRLDVSVMVGENEFLMGCNYGH